MKTTLFPGPGGGQKSHFVGTGRVAKIAFGQDRGMAKNMCGQAGL